MHSHPNARLPQPGRTRLVIQYLDHCRRLTELAAQNRCGFSEACGYSLRYG
jgi:hypothetical protein